MLLGLDFDNTIVCYDGVFHRLAVAQGLIPPEVATPKDAVRNYLREVGREDDWTELQGEVYGPGILAADSYPGLFDFIAACGRAGVDICIVSHKTRTPYRGKPHDLHAAARSWLEAKGLEAEAYFELTKEAKLARIASLGCDAFIDDLPELLSLAEFPAGVRKVLFDPADQHSGTPGMDRVTSWAEAGQLLLTGRSGG